MSNDGGAERRAKKAERRAQNIRKYSRPGDRGAERRAQKAERRAQNIRDFAEERRAQDGPSTRSSDSDDTATFILGCVIVLLVIAAVAKVIDVVRGWFDWLF